MRVTSDRLGTTFLMSSKSIHIRVQAYTRKHVCVCPSDCPPVRLPIRPSACPSVCLSVRSSVRPSVCPSVCSSVGLSVRPSIHPTTYLTVCLYTHTHTHTQTNKMLTFQPSGIPKDNIFYTKRGKERTYFPIHNFE